MNNEIDLVNVTQEVGISGSSQCIRDVPLIHGGNLSPPAETAPLLSIWADYLKGSRSKEQALSIDLEGTQLSGARCVPPEQLAWLS